MIESNIILVERGINPQKSTNKTALMLLIAEIIATEPNTYWYTSNKKSF